MRRVVLQNPGRFQTETVAEPSEPAHGQALVKVRRIGVCGTDLHAFAGRQPFFTYPRVLGHELGVEILQLNGDQTELQVGDQCAVEPYLSCGHCRPCRIGRYNCCETLQCMGVHCDGGMCQLLRVPIDRLHCSKQLTLDQLALVETLGIGQHAVERAHLQAGEQVLVVGAGPIGLAVTQFALAAGADVTVLETNPNRRIFVEQFGAKAVEATAGRMYDVVIDATGNKAAMEASFQHVAFGGKLVFVGLILDTISFDDPMFHRREMTLMASRNSAGAFPTIIADIEAGRIDTRPWISHRIGLEEVEGRFAELPKSNGLIKAIIEVD